MNSILNKKPFDDLELFAEQYSVEYDKATKSLRNFKLFIIMDTDDCSETIKDKYMSGELFQDCVLQKYIVPIYNIPNLENVMKKSGILGGDGISNSEKGRFYSKIFPINTEPLSYNTIDQVTTFAERIEKVKETNILKFIDYCLQQISEK